MFHNRIKARLAVRKSEGLYRTLFPATSREGKFISDDARRYINFSSNDYLGLGSCEELHDIVKTAFEKYNVSSSSSRLICGNCSALTEAENAYAEYFGYESALFFQSGYQANLAVMTTLFDKEDSVFYDKHIHASLAKGIEWSGAATHGYAHNNLDHLEKRIAKSRNNSNCALVTESLFSMDGDCVDVEKLGSIKTRHSLLTIVDEAHSFGLLGDKGKGIAHSVADIATGTFGKAFHLFGAFVLLPQNFKEYLLNFGSPVIYSTALPEAHAAAALGILGIVERSDPAREQCLSTAQLLRTELQSQGFAVSGDKQIVVVEIGKAERAVAVAERLKNRGLFTHAVRFPTVPHNKAILRISITALHNAEDIAFLVKSIKEVTDEL